MIAASEMPPEPIEPVGGLGGKVRSERVASGLTAIHEARMLTTAVKRGWLAGQRWPVDATEEDFRRVSDERALTMKEKAALAVLMDCGHLNPKVRQIAVRNALGMESQNMAQQERDNPKPLVPTTQINIDNRQVIVLVEDENFYGRATDCDEGSEALAAPATDPAIAGQVQGSGLRPEIRQNGHGPANGFEGPRNGHSET